MFLRWPRNFRSAAGFVTPPPIEELLTTDAEESNSVEKFKSSIEELDLVEFLVAQVASLSSCRSHCGGGM
jgi:hypothetical protein